MIKNNNYKKMNKYLKFKIIIYKNKRNCRSKIKGKI